MLKESTDRASRGSIAAQRVAAVCSVTWYS
jgi:hypothetical protein